MSENATITAEQFDAVCDVIDRVKLDDDQDDTDTYAREVLSALDLEVEGEDDA